MSPIAYSVKIGKFTTFKGKPGYIYIYTKNCIKQLIIDTVVATVSILDI